MKKLGWVVIICLATAWISPAALAEGLSADREREIIQLVLSVYEPNSPLLATGQTADIRKCGTPLQIELHTLWPQLSAETQALLKPYVQPRPDLPLYYDVPPENHFRIHYDTVSTNSHSVDMSYGVDIDGTPNYVKTCATILQEVWQREIEEMDYPAPPADNFYAEGGTAALDIYIVAMPTGILGQTTPDEVFIHQTRNIPVSTAFIEIDNDYQGFGYPSDQWDEVMAVTLAHEFFHAVQMGIDASESLEGPDDLASDYWWLEMTATWMEDMVYDDVNDYYNYLQYFFDHPNWALTTQGLTGPRVYYPYAACVWPRFLTEKFGEQIIHDIWMECGQHAYFNTLSAWANQITSRGSGLRDELGRFRLWCYFSGERHDPDFFLEGAEYPTFDELELVASHDVYPVEDSVRLTLRPEFLGVSYLKFNRPELGENTDFKVQITDGQLDLWTVSGAGTGEYIDPNLVSQEDITNPLVIPDWELFDNVMVMVIPYSEDYSRDKNITAQKFYYVVSDTLEAIEGNEIHTVYPNPFDPTDDDLVIKVFREDKEETEVFFYTTAGELVRGGKADPTFHLEEGQGKHPHYFRWDGLNNAQQEVASGVYLCLVRLGNRQSIQKVAVFRP